MKAENIMEFFIDIINCARFALEMARDVSRYFSEEMRHQMLCLDLS